MGRVKRVFSDVVPTRSVIEPLTLLWVQAGESWGQVLQFLAPASQVNQFCVRIQALPLFSVLSTSKKVL